MAEEASKWTWLAIIVAFLLLIPFLFVGGLAAYLYNALYGWIFEGGLFNWITAGWFEKIVKVVFPSIIQGGVAGFLALFVTSKILKRANYEVVAYTISGIVIFLTLLTLLLGLARNGLNIGMIGVISNTIGIVVGLFGMYLDHKEKAGLSA